MRGSGVARRATSLALLGSLVLLAKPGHSSRARRRHLPSSPVSEDTHPQPDLLQLENSAIPGVSTWTSKRAAIASGRDASRNEVFRSEGGAKAGRRQGRVEGRRRSGGIHSASGFPKEKEKEEGKGEELSSVSRFYDNKVFAHSYVPETFANCLLVRSNVRRGNITA